MISLDILREFRYQRYRKAEWGSNLYHFTSTDIWKPINSFRKFYRLFPLSHTYIFVIALEEKARRMELEQRNAQSDRVKTHQEQASRVFEWVHTQVNPQYEVTSSRIHPRLVLKRGFVTGDTVIRFKIGVFNSCIKMFAWRVIENRFWQWLSYCQVLLSIAKEFTMQKHVYIFHILFINL